MARRWKTATAALWAALVLAAAFWTVSDGVAGQDRKPILMGGSLSLTGRYPAMGKMQEMGYRLFEKETNAAGGLLGRPVALRILDDGSNTENVRSEYGTDPSYHAASAYASMQLLSMAIRETGSTDREKIRANLLSVEHGTILGPFRLRKDGTQIGHRSIIIQWQNGRKEIVWPQKMRTARPVFP